MVSPEISPDDLAILRLAAAGLTVESIGRRVGLSERTVRRRLHGLCTLLEVDSTIEVVVWAARRGMV